MKHIYIVALISLLSFSTAMASEVAPSYLKGGTITVTLKNGKTYSFSADEYMVVKRHAPTALVGPMAPAPERVVILRDKAPEPKRNTVTVYGGAGHDGLSVDKTATSLTVKQDTAPVFGFGYSRLLNDEVSLQAVGLSNSTGLLGVGLSF